MKFVFFCHAITSCWNNGNAHFLRGVTRELAQLGHEVVVYERADGWSRMNAISDGGAAVLPEAQELLRGVDVREFFESTLDLDAATGGADVVVAHEWNTPELIARLGRARANGAAFRLLFHDTHHRAITAPREFAQFDLEGYDGALVFGESLREAYLRGDLAHRVFTWHEAADTALFRPLPGQDKDCDLVWIGNWGDEERSAELREYLIAPSARSGLRTRIHGVRYPADARGELAANGLDYEGWLPNHRAPLAFARAQVTVHVPRRPYVRALPGIPTIRVFEALACGIPLICSPWPDTERLFPAGAYVTVSNGAAMTRALLDLLDDRGRASEQVQIGLRSILKSHTCRHRALELIARIEQLGPRHALQRPARTGEQQTSEQVTLQ